jgi:hypothetical protein
VAESGAFQYRAFVSCSKADRRWGKWLQSSLAHYPIDNRLVGRPTPIGAVPRTLGPVYRDRAVADDRPLEPQTLAALRASQFLIVLCSPEAAKSRRVSEQVRCFTSHNRADRIIPVIVDDASGDLARQCFPPALQFRLRQERWLFDRRGGAVAALARLDRDGKEHVKHKTAAALLCVGIDDVERGARRARKRRLQVGCIRLVTTVLGLAFLWQAGTAWTRYQLSHNDTLLARAALVTNGAMAVATEFGQPVRGALGRLPKF